MYYYEIRIHITSPKMIRVALDNVVKSLLELLNLLGLEVSGVVLKEKNK